MLLFTVKKLLNLPNKFPSPPSCILILFYLHDACKSNYLAVFYYFPQSTYLGYIYETSVLFFQPNTVSNSFKQARGGGD